jgi:hypothetical protein
MLIFFSKIHSFHSFVNPAIFHLSAVGFTPYFKKNFTSIFVFSLSNQQVVYGTLFFFNALPTNNEILWNYSKNNTYSVSDLFAFLVE